MSGENKKDKVSVEVDVMEVMICCPFCQVGTLSFYELPVTGRPEVWPEDALCMAECNRCSHQDFLVKLPKHLAKVLTEAIKGLLPAEAIVPVRKALGLYKS